MRTMCISVQPFSATRCWPRPSGHRPRGRLGTLRRICLPTEGASAMTRASSRWLWAVPLLSSPDRAGGEGGRGQKDDEDKPPSGQVYDEARRVRRTAATFPAADEDYF